MKDVINKLRYVSLVKYYKFCLLLVILVKRIKKIGGFLYK